MSPTVNEITSWLRRKATEAATRGFVVGLSGGLDSAVVARLCQLAAPGQVLGIILPCCSDPRDEADARLVAERFEIPAIHIDLEPAYEAIVSPVRAALDELPIEMRGTPGEDSSRVALG